MPPPEATPSESGVTRVLLAAAAGDARAADELLPLVYDELRRLAASRLADEVHAPTLQPTALVHEAWLRICRTDQRSWSGRAHFLASASRAMRRILVDRARRRLAGKRGNGAERVDLDPRELAGPDEDTQILDLHGALEQLAREHPRKAELVELRYFAGLSFAEAAAVLGIAVPTAKQWWAYARAWLRVEISPSRRGGEKKVK